MATLTRYLLYSEVESSYYYIVWLNIGSMLIEETKSSYYRMSWQGFYATSRPEDNVGSQVHIVWGAL